MTIQRRKIFVTGTDTDVGKTFVATAILLAAKNRGLSTGALKPVAAGCEQTVDGLRNTDALMLQQAATLDLYYEQVNPIALEAAIAPHVAAQQIGRRLDIERIAGFCRGAMMQPADLWLVEGAGGWRVPLNHRQYFSGIAQTLQLDVVMVVNMQLGCINHAVLTAEAIERDGLKLAGWVANTVHEPMAAYAQNLETLDTLIRAPRLGEIPYIASGDPAEAADYLALDSLFSAS